MATGKQRDVMGRSSSSEKPSDGKAEQSMPSETGDRFDSTTESFLQHFHIVSPIGSATAHPVRAQTTRPPAPESLQAVLGVVPAQHFADRGVTSACIGVLAGETRRPW